jgi:hypothetical protein
MTDLRTARTPAPTSTPVQATPTVSPTPVGRASAATDDDTLRKIKKLQKTVKRLKAEVKGLRQAAKVGSDANAPVMRTASMTQSPDIEVRSSGVHGKGVFATADLPRGTRLIEYVGELLSWKKAQKRHPHNPAEPNHTFFFHIDDQLVIDAAVGGNDARWINHACDPNCEADEEEGRIYIKTLRKIKAGSELFYDYGLIIDEPYTKKLKAEYQCRCGSKKCRGTMLAPKD